MTLIERDAHRSPDLMHEPRNVVEELQRLGVVVRFRRPFGIHWCSFLQAECPDERRNVLTRIAISNLRAPDKPREKQADWLSFRFRRRKFCTRCKGYKRAPATSFPAPKRIR
jgi:hypothetical protein